MGRARNDSGLQFMTVAEAAELLRVNSMTLRSAAVRGLIPSKRDNEGRLRLDISGVRTSGDALVIPESAKLAPTEMIDILFDEVEELQSDLQDRDEQIVRLLDVSGRQAGAIDNAGRALDEAEHKQTRLSVMLDRALSHLEAGADREARLTNLSGRSANLLDATGDRLEQSLSQSGRFEQLLERAMRIAAEGSNGDGASEAMTAAVDRAMLMLDDALNRAEQGQSSAKKASELLDRALSTAERIEDQVQERDRRIEQQGTALETALSMSERAVALADQNTRPKRRGWFGWLFGR